VKRYGVRFTPEAEDDLSRLYDFLGARSDERSRRVAAFLSVLLPQGAQGQSVPEGARHPFGSAGYVALFEIESDRTVNILAVRHQREEDYL
jgi:plasmid stabilization system protein ParE